MDAPTIEPIDDSGLVQVSRPLLELVQFITGMESSFVTSIDWDALKQDVICSLNTGPMQVPEGSQVDWRDSMCRSMFLSGRSHTDAVGQQVPATPGAMALEMQSFFALPILIRDRPIGTVCGASRRQIQLGEEQMRAVGLIAQALQQLLQAVREKRDAEVRAKLAEVEARDAHLESRRHAQDSERMAHLAHTDVLTGLPNRRAFISRWEDELARSARRAYPIGLMLIDADRFKSVNDNFGHSKGDAVLRAIGTALLEVARSADTVARLGGDEFALVVAHCDAPALLAKAANIQRIFAQTAAELDVDTTLSIGIVTSDTCPRLRMLAEADAELYRSKAAGGDRAQLSTCAGMEAGVHRGIGGCAEA